VDRNGVVLDDTRELAIEGGKGFVEIERVA
jgi:hypothetical protein